MDSIGETPEALAQATAALREQLVAAADPTEPEASDTFLHRFVRWAKMDPTKACERYTDYWAKLRELFPSGAISATDSDGLVATLRLGVYEIPPVRDREGRQVVVLRPRRVDYSVATPEHLAQAVWVVADACLEDVETQRCGICIVDDFDGYSIAQSNRKTSSLVMNSIQQCLPVRVGVLLLCNQGWVHHVILSVIKLFVTAKMKKRLTLIGHHYDRLDEWLEPSSIPTELGGTLEYDATEWLDTLCAPK